MDIKTINRWRKITHSKLVALGEAAGSMPQYYANAYTENDIQVRAFNLLDPELVKAGFTDLTLQPDGRWFVKYGKYPLRVFIQHIKAGTDAKMLFTCCAANVVTQQGVIEVAQWVVERVNKDYVIRRAKFDVAKLVL